MRGMISSSFILLLGSVLTFAEDAGADSPPMHDSGLLSLPPPPHSAALQQREAVNPPPDGLARDAYMLSDDQGLERLLSSDSPNTDSSQPFTQPLDDLLQRITQLVQQEQKGPTWYRKSYAPMFFGEKSAPLFIGNKSAPYFVGEKSSPYVVDKRAVTYFVGQESAPYLVYEKAAPYFVGKKGAPYFVGKRSVGQKSVPMFVGKMSEPMFVGKKAAPMFVGKWRFLDILGNLSGPNMQELFVSPSARIPSTDDSENEFVTRNMYPAPFFIGKRYNIPLSLAKESRKR